MADDIDAPHEQWFEIDRSSDALAVAKRLMAGTYLAYVGFNATWTLALGRDHVVFGRRYGLKFFRLFVMEGAAMRAADTESIHVTYAAQQSPKAVASQIRQKFVRR